MSFLIGNDPAEETRAGCFSVCSSFVSFHVCLFVVCVSLLTLDGNFEYVVASVKSYKFEVLGT